MSEIEKALAVKEKKSGNRRISGMGVIRRIFSCKPLMYCLSACHKPVIAFRLRVPEMLPACRIF